MRRKESRKKLFFIVPLLLIFPFLLWVRDYVSQPITGDEPHYLVMGQSLKADHDLNLKNNYLQKDYYKFTGEEQPYHISPRNFESGGGWYSFHGVGLAILTLPGFVLMGTTGVIVMMVLFAWLTIMLAGIWAYSVFKQEKYAALTAFLVFICYFFLGLNGYIYPDMVIVSLSVLVFILLSLPKIDTLILQASLGTVLGIMVFIHFRMIAFAVPVALYFIYRYHKEHKKYPLLFISIGTLMAILFIGLTRVWFGVWLPNKIYSNNVGVSLVNLRNTPAILFDSLRGLVPYNPITLLIAVGLPIWKKIAPKSFKLLYLLIPLAIVSFGFNEWPGGVSPTGRYFLWIIVLLMPAAVMYYRYAVRRIDRLIFYILTSLTLLISAIGILIKQPYVGYAPRTNIFIKIEQFIHGPIDSIFPTYLFTNSTLLDRYGALQSLLWMFLLFILFIYGSVISRKVSKG